MATTMAPATQQTGNRDSSRNISLWDVYHYGQSTVAYSGFKIIKCKF